MKTNNTTAGETAGTKEQVYFVDVDEFNRPTFRSVNRSDRYYCDTDNLFNYNVAESAVLDWYQKYQGRESAICYKGRKFDSEPDGTPAQVEIVTKAKAFELRKANKEWRS